MIEVGRSGFLKPNRFSRDAPTERWIGLQSIPLTRQIRRESHFDEIVGESEALRRVLGEVETVASTDSTVLIYGETGHWKELIARAVHNLSPRKSPAFVKLNCAAIPTGLRRASFSDMRKAPSPAPSRNFVAV